MAKRSGPGKISGSTRIGDAGDKDGLIAELKGRIVILEKELRLMREEATSQDGPERGRAGGALKANEEMFRAFVETTNAGIALFRGDRYIYVNPMIENALGYSKDELLAMNYWDIVHPDFRELVRSRGRARIQGLPAPSRYEIKVLTKGGEALWAEFSAAMIDYQGQPTVIATIFDITERKQAEEALAESKANMQALFNATRESIFLMEPDGTVVAINNCAARRIGSTPEELAGNNLYDRHSPELARSRRGHLDEVSRTGNPARWEDERDGRTLDNSVYPIFSEDGKVVRLAVFSRDVTEERRAIKALAASEEKYRELVENANSIIIRWDMRGNLTFFNEFAEKLLGYSKDEILGKDVVGTIVPPSESSGRDLAALMEEVKRCPERFKLNVNENMCKNGDRVWIAWTNKAIRDERGDVVEILSVGNDITERRRAEEALQESERFLDNVFEGIQEGICILDRDMNIVKANHAMERWYSHMLPLVGKKCYHAFHGRTSACEVCPSTRAMKEKTMQTGIVPYINESGFAGWQELYSSPLKDDKGNVIGIIQHVRDVTERKKAEKELVNAKAQAELYLDLMGHDINNLHQVALGYLELARDMPASEEQAMFLDKPVEVLQRSAKLISNVRKLQKLHDGLFQDQDIDLCKVLSDVYEEFGAVPNKKITFSLNRVGRCHVHANELLHDVFSNLVSNAIKHTGDSACIILDLDVVEDDGRKHYRVMVEDDGPGIPDGFKATIFNRTLKGTDKAKGMGLGLYLVKSLVDSYGGRVWVEDRILGDHTKGARFVVMLPAAEKCSLNST